MGALQGKPGGRTPLLGTERNVKKALEMSISLHRGPNGGTWRGGSFTRDVERQVKEGSGNRASLWELCEGNLEGGLLCWGL
jgi:hypothetical protein